jgi:tetraacyldisaccharide 4'-kinase
MTDTLSDNKYPTGRSPLPGSLARTPLTRLAAGLYGTVVKARNGAFDRLPSLARAAERPVISVGSIRAGGTGKTPFALLTAKYLLSKGYAVAFLSRGYRRKERGLRIVKPHETVPWEQIGDEPQLLHQRLPETWLGIGADRHASAAALAPLLPHRAAFVLDDGFQHRRLKRDLDIICLHGSPFTDRLLPHGYLREPPASLARSHAIVLIGSSDEATSLDEQRTFLATRFPATPIFTVFQHEGSWINLADGAIAPLPPFKNPLLLCGIARPERFITMVRKSGITPSAERIFPDHHFYTINDIPETHELYLRGVITTEKDAVRLKGLNIVPAPAIWYLSIDLRFADTDHKHCFFSLIDKVTQ